jgi:hypothetical protein
MTPEQYDKLNSTLKKITTLGEEKKNELTTLLIDMDLDIDRMCTLTIHPCISSTCIHTSNKFH